MKKNDPKLSIVKSKAMKLIHSKLGHKLGDWEDVVNYAVGDYNIDCTSISCHHCDMRFDINLCESGTFILWRHCTGLATYTWKDGSIEVNEEAIAMDLDGKLVCSRVRCMV